jgi:hypothetical protein
MAYQVGSNSSTNQNCPDAGDAVGLDVRPQLSNSGLLPPLDLNNI